MVVNLFGQNFGVIEEFNEFCLSLNTVEKTIRAIKDKNRVLFDYNWKGFLEEQINRALNGDELKALNKQSQVCYSRNASCWQNVGE